MEIQVIRIKSEEGNELVIQFTPIQLSDKSLGSNVDLPIVDITLISEKKLGTNGLSSLNRVVQCIDNYLKENECVLYYYCDHSPIDRRDVTVSPQRFRHRLFNALLQRSKDKNIIKESIIINDPEGDHYISILSRIEHEKQLDDVFKFISDLEK